MNTLLAWLAKLLESAKWWTTVMPWERAVRVRAGKLVRSWGPGLHLRIPFVDDVRVVNSRLRVAAVPSQTVSTRDGKTVTLAGQVGFCITDPTKALLRLQQPENTCAAFVQAALAKEVAKRKSDELLVEDLQACALAALDELPGIEFEFVHLVEFAVVPTLRLLQESWRPATWSNDAENR